MTGTNRAVTRTGAALLVAALLLACGRSEEPRKSTPPVMGAQLQKLVAAATAEGALALQWSTGTMDSPDELRRQITGFNKAYGFDLKVTYRPGPSLAEMTASVIAELKAGRPAPSDVVAADEAQIYALMKANALEPVLWTTWAPNIHDVRLVTPGGAAVQVQTRIPGITYSTRLGSDAPRTLADLLRPGFRGRVATTPQGAGFDHLGSPDVWGPAKTLEYVRRLSAQVGGLLNCGDEDRLVNGELDVFVYDCGSGRAALLKQRGVPVGWSVPTDGAFVGYLYLAVPKNAAHPNAAKLWINHMLSRAAQDVMFEYELTDLHLLAGSKSFADVDRYTKAGVRFYELTVEFVESEDNKGLRSLRPEIQSILQRVVPR